MAPIGSLRRRGRFWLPLLLIAAFFLLNLGGWWYFSRTEASLVETVGGRLLDAARLVAAQIEPELLLAAKDFFDPDAFIHLDTTLQAARLRGDFESVFILDPEGNDWLQGNAGSDASLLAAAAGGAFAAATVGVAATSQLYRSGDDYFLASCVPLSADDSLVIAVLAAEAGSDYFGALDELRFGLLLLDVLAALLFVGIGVIWAGVQRRLTRVEEAAIRSAQLAAMGQMVATVAHELKNPLGIIRNSAERIRKKYGTPDEPLLTFIPEEVDRLDSLLKRYLQFARLEVGPVANVDLEPLTTSLQTQLPLSADAPPRLNWLVPGGVAVRADPAALRQILLNILLNAVEASREKPRAVISLTARRDGSAVSIEVRDNGVGMDAETLRRVAEPFFTTRPDGSGLGIYLARTLTEKMKGSMQIDSQPGEGTTVTLNLPAAGAH